MLKCNKQFIYGVFTTLAFTNIYNGYNYSNNILRETSEDAYDHLNVKDKILSGVFTINDINKLKNSKQGK